MRKNLVCGDRILTKEEIENAAREQTIEYWNLEEGEDPTVFSVYTLLKRFPHKLKKFQCPSCQLGLLFSCRDRKWKTENIWKGEQRTMYIIRSSSTDVCPICIGPVQNRKTIKTGCCRHEFHEKCFENFFYYLNRRWLGGTPCPCCRTTINETFEVHLWWALRHKDYIPGKLKK